MCRHLPQWSRAHPSATWHPVRSTQAKVFGPQPRANRPRWTAPCLSNTSNTSPKLSSNHKLHSVSRTTDPTSYLHRLMQALQSCAQYVCTTPWITSISMMTNQQQASQPAKFSALFLLKLSISGSSSIDGLVHIWKVDQPHVTCGRPSGRRELREFSAVNSQPPETLVFF